MTTLNYTPLLTQQQYVDALVGFITGIEGEAAHVYADDDGKATIGYGYTFNRNNNVALWQAAGISLTATELALLQQIDAATTKAEKTRLGLTWSRDVSNAEATTLLLETYPEYEAPANTLLMPFSFERVAFVSMTYNRGVNANMQGFINAVQSGNRAEAWYQMRYNSFTVDATGLPGLPKRRYLESAMFDLYSDPASMSPDAILNESKDVYRMFTLHRAEIASYESKYGVGLDGTRGTVLSNGRTPLELAISEATGLGIAQVDTLVQALNPAKLIILGDLASNANPDIAKAYAVWVAAGNDQMNFDPTKLFLDTGRGIAVDARQYTVPGVMGVEITSNDIVIGEGVAGATGLGGDMLVGGMGNDLLIGGSGDDVQYGGAGNDIMAGGAGNDTYILDGGGRDTIEDKQGNNRVFLNGKALFNFTTADGINYLSADGAFAGILQNGDFIVTDLVTRDQVTLNQNFQSGDFGITLSDAPAAIQPTNTITGDIAPTDIDPATAGIQAAADANGNPVGQAGAYEDILFGTAGNDHIQSGELSDNVFGLGGDDLMEGGAGSDYLSGNEGADTIEGGAGSDILFGDTGNDTIYSNAMISVSDAIAAGDTVNMNGSTCTGLKGDWLSGWAGDDTLVAGADNDVLAGGGGNDLIIAGAGDDFILGDAEYTAQFITEADPRYSLNGINRYHSTTGTFDWNVVQDSSGTWIFQQVAGAIEPADSGNDVIYAGDGADRVWAGDGVDVVYGDAANDESYKNQRQCEKKVA